MFWLREHFNWTCYSFTCASGCVAMCLCAPHVSPHIFISIFQRNICKIADSKSDWEFNCAVRVGRSDMVTWGESQTNACAYLTAASVFLIQGFGYCHCHCHTHTAKYYNISYFDTHWKCESAATPACCVHCTGWIHTMTWHTSKNNNNEIQWVLHSVAL